MLRGILLLVCIGIFLLSAREAEAGAANRFPEREGKIAVPGGNIWYKIVNPAAKGVPLICIHGGPGMPHDYLEPLEDLADERPVIFYDQLGCGNSDIPTETSLWQVERFIVELDILRQQLGIDRCYLLGQSWGSMLAAAYLTQDKTPAGVEAVIFAGPALSAPRFINDTKTLVEALPPTTRAIISDCERRGDYENPQYQEALQLFYSLHVCRIPWPDYVLRALGKMGMAQYSYMWGPSEFTATGILKNFDATPKLPLLKIPVLLTCGEFDEATPVATMYYASLLPNSQYVVYKNASHLHHGERRADFVIDVREFLNNKKLQSGWK
ncbi:MAG: proline iminopeptidase-family hydrolase [Negativicutes bacterium]|jgi:proline iminopeptidase